jgi:hypothetical protein
MDMSSLAGGGYCVRYDSANVAADSYYMTDSEFDDALDTESISTSYLISDTADNDIGFEIFSCVVVADTSMVCDHFQKRPANTYSDGFRFESDK